MCQTPIFWIASSRKDERSEDGIASADRVRRDAFVSSRASVCEPRERLLEALVEGLRFAVDTSIIKW